MSDVNAHLLTNPEGRMKKLLFILLLLIFASPASATVYKWADDRGVTNFTDDYSKVPRNYRNQVEEVSMPKTGSPTLSQAPPEKMGVGANSGESAGQPPPIAQTLVREGDFAMKLAEALKLGQAKNEAEAESTLASAGIAPKNGWIADYPVTPDIVGELENAVGTAADSGKLRMEKVEALKAFRTAAVELQLPIIAEIPNEYTESSSPTASQYAEPSAIDNYYETEGPPVVTYYTPPPDYYYLYAWVPRPFWCSGFFFPGFFILHDFHRVAFRHSRPFVITNHIRDPGTGRTFALDPSRRQGGSIFGRKDTLPKTGFNSTEARRGAQSIFERSRGRVALSRPLMPITGRGVNGGNSTYSRPGRVTERRMENRGSQPLGLIGRNSHQGRPPASSRSMDRQYGMNLQRPSTGEPRSFSSTSRGPARSVGPSTHGGGQHFGSSGTGSRGSSPSRQGGSHTNASGRGNSRF